MSVLTSPRGTVEVVHCRRTESQDICCIQKLIRKFTQKLFGKLNLIYLLEKANLAITLHNDREEIMAHAIFVDYPNWNVAQQDNWVSVFRELDSDIPCTPLNTLFMHLFVAVDEYSNGCCKEMLRTVFKAVPELHFIFLIVPAYMSIGSTLINVFDLVGNVPSLAFDEDFSVHICHRHNHYPQLHIRRARKKETFHYVRVEDHDALMPILMRHDTFLKETYGEYFLAELIEAQDEENQAAVCEVEGMAVGFMNVCSRVNIQLLHECFDLGPFHGLCIPHPEDVLEPPKKLKLYKNKVAAYPLVIVEVSRDATSKTCIDWKGEPEGKLLDAELKSSSYESMKKLEKLSEPVASEPVESAQKKIVEETEPQKLSTEVQHGVSEVEVRKVSPVSSVGELHHSFSDPSLTPTLMPDTSSFRPVYKGAASAFCIQLFCVDENYEARSLDFMDFVFGLFPNKNFCVISLPHMTPEFVLIQNFVKIVPFSNCTLEQDLYVFHRAGLLKSINIRFATKSDVPGVENLVSTLVLSRSILDDVNQYTNAYKDADGTPLQAFVASVADQVVGVAVTRDEMDIEYIRSHYNIEDFIYFSHHQRREHTHLYHFALNPIFRHYSKFFLKEIFRLGFKSCLYYPIYQTHREGKFQSSLAHSLTSVLHHLVPVRPRRQIVYPLEKLGINAPSESVSKEPLGFALYHTNRKLTLEPKITVNAKIVVVGASNVGISFLETLVFCSHLKFSSLTLISTHGLPGKRLLESEERKFLSTDHCFNDKDHALMLLCSWVNVVVGRMTAIDRAAKHVVVSKDEIVLYDHLILCTGQQYQVPCPSGVDINLLPTNREVANKSKQRYTGQVPRNHFLLNDEEDCFETLAWIRNNSIIPEGNVIVYGNTLDTYTTVETLLHIGIKGCHIYLVQPPCLYTTTCFNNYVVDNAMDAALAAEGVTVYRDALLAQWNDGQNPDPIYCASFTTFTKPFKLFCSMFFSFCEKNVDYETFKAFNDACLVYDGRLVIDTSFHTNDLAIRAAGSLTKFSNRYYANEWTHSNFSSKEIGFQLAATMLNLFDPTIEPVTEPPPELDRLIPMYKGPKIQGGILPRSYYYLHIAKPAIPTPLEVHMTQADFGTEIVTGTASDGNYFRIHINKYNMVETITCLSKKPFPTSNYIRLFGQHEQVLNNLCSRFSDNMIPDLYSFFEESWSMAIFHDRFIDLRKKLRQILISSEEENSPSMDQLALQIEDEELTLNEKPRKYLKQVYEQSIYKPLVEKSILDYLHYNHYHLPMYAWPGII